MNRRLRHIAVVTVVALGVAYSGGTAAQAAPVPAAAVHLAEAPALTDAELERHITEVYDTSGSVVGYTVDAETRATLDRLAREMRGIGAKAQLGAFVDGGMRTNGAVECAGAILSFVALAIFPAARVAKLAVRLARMVNKYGVTKVAQIFTRAYKGSDRTALKEVTELAAALAGVDQLKKCGLNF